MNANDKGFLSSYRFRELETREAPAQAKSQPDKPVSEKTAQLHAEAGVGRFSGAHHERVETRKALTKNGRVITHGEVGQEKAKAEPMRKDAAPLDQLIAKPQQGQQRPGSPSPAPGGTLWSHAPGARSQTQRPNAPGSDSPGGDGKKLEFFADRNPDHDKTPSPTR